MARWVRWNNPTIKPPFGAQIDWSNPITEGLIGCWMFNEFSTPGQFLNLAQNKLPNVISGTPSYKTDYVVFNSANPDYCKYFLSNNLDLSDYKVTLVSKYFIAPDTGTSPKTPISISNTNSSTAYSIRFSKSYGKLKFEVKTDVATSSTISPAPVTRNKFYTVCGRLASPTNTELWINGALVDSDTTTDLSGSNMQIYNGFGIGECFSSIYNTLKFDGGIKFAFIFKKALTPNEIKQLHHEPYSFFLYPQYWYLVDFGGINSIEYSSLYDILNKNEYNNKYDIQTKAEKNIKYDILAQNSYVSKYDILTKKETSVSYDILTKADYSINYDILNRLTKEVSYDILSAKEYNSKYDLLNSLTTSILYNILTKNEYNVIYDILGTTAIEYTIKYDILNSAQTNIVFDILSKKETNIKYNILTSRTSNIIYDILAKTLTSIIYDILTKKETTFSYNIINKKETNFKYDILATKLYTNIYNILTKSEYKILYDILSDIIIRPEVIFKLDKQDTILKVRKSNTIFVLDKSNNTRNY